MAGLSSRFAKAGYDKPKFMLEAHGHSLFHHSVVSFRQYFSTEKFLFIALRYSEVKSFIESECQDLGISNFDIVLLENPTSGQAETVYQGLLLAAVNSEEPVLIFNIDTFRPNFSFPDNFDIKSTDGYLETFVGTGKNWSNILPLETGNSRVKLTAEKKEISEFCCTGLYFFGKSSLFKEAYRYYAELPVDQLDAGERYIAPMYNYLISEGFDIRYSIISENDVIFCGVPAEYEAFKNISSETE